MLRRGGGAIGGRASQSEAGLSGGQPVGSQSRGGRGGPRGAGWAGSGARGEAGPAARPGGGGESPAIFQSSRPVPPPRGSAGRSRGPSRRAMAPLLGRKPFPLAKPLPAGEPGERFIIPHTQEAFRTREYPHGRGGGGGGGGRDGPGAASLSPAGGSGAAARAASVPGGRGPGLRGRPGPPGEGPCEAAAGPSPGPRRTKPGREAKAAGIRRAAPASSLARAGRGSWRASPRFAGG